MINDICECSEVNNGSRVGFHFKFTEENDFTEEEVRNAKKLWSKVGFGEMTEVYKCTVCGHGWMSYRRLSTEYNYK